MAKVKFGEPFGLDGSLIKSIDWTLAVSRVLHDVRSDFIYAPHLSMIYAWAGPELVAKVKSELSGGNYVVGNPLTIEVPKTYRMQVMVQSKRLGPNFSRPGSILLPKDRLLYQVLADKAAPIVAKKTDATRSFSHQLLSGKAKSQMFKATRASWSDLQAALQSYSSKRSISYVLRLDIADYFGSINQHTLINTLQDDGFDSSLLARLESMMTGYTGQRSSRGILQGMYPSDLFGAYYLTPIDRFLSEYGVSSARYVDDLYIFVDSVDEAEKLLRSLIPRLRSYDLVLSEAKSKIFPKSYLLTEEPDLEDLFSQAVEEVAEQLSGEDSRIGYGFQAEWEGEDEDEDEGDGGESSLVLEATKVLFDSIGEYPGQEENIERFCLPLFSQAGSDYAVQHVFDAFAKRASMSQIYAAYLAHFVDEDESVAEFLSGRLVDSGIADWQKMWVVAALLKRKPDSDEVVKRAWGLAKDGGRHDALRAVCAIYVGRYGDLDRRKALIELYNTVSPYVQLAIYYSSRTWPAAERAGAKGMWGAQGELNSLLTTAIANRAKSIAR